MYTSVEEYKNKIYLTEVQEENGKPITSFHVIDNFKPSVYVEANKESNIKGFPYNTDLQKITFDNIKEFKDYNYRMKDIDNRLYGNIEAQYQYINDMYSKTDNTKLRYWFADIETEVPKGNFPNPETEEITYIQIYDNVEDFIYIISTTKDYKPHEDDVKYIKCNTEKELLDTFLKLYYHFKPTAVAGINYVHFDTNFISKRLDILGYEKNILSPFSKSYKHKYKKFNKDFEISLPIGVTWIDYMDIVDTHAYLKLGGKSLDVLANKVLGDTKLNWKRYAKSFYDLVHFKYTPPFDITDEEKEEPIYKAWLNKDEDSIQHLLHRIFTEYSILDVRLLKEIDKKLGMMNVMYNFSWAMGCNPYDSLKTVVPWDTFLYGRLKDKNKITASFFGDDEKYKIAGGYWNATPGLHKAIASFDFNSQYPIGDATLNICPSTHIKGDDIPKELQELVKPLQKYRDENGKLQDRDDNMFIYLDFPEEKKERILELLIENNFTMSPNGTFFTKDFKGEIPILIEEIYNQRVEVKKLMKQAFNDGDVDLGNLYNIQQMILKIIINSLFGYLASKYFKLGSADLGGAITAFGRFSLMTKKNCVNEIHKKITGKDIVVSNSATDCLDGSTEIKTDIGNITLEDIYNANKNNIIKKNDNLTLCYLGKNVKVLSNNIDSGINEYKKITRVSRKISNEKRYKITYNNNTVIATANHIFYVNIDGNIVECKAKDLKPHYEIITSVS